jgi:hypothetical protein
LLRPPQTGIELAATMITHRIDESARRLCSNNSKTRARGLGKRSNASVQGRTLPPSMRATLDVALRRRARRQATHSELQVMGPKSPLSVPVRMAETPLGIPIPADC